jgi:hypothetical protein
MNPYLFPIALLGFVAFVAVVPVWTWFISDWSHVSGLSQETMLLAGVVLPATISMYVASWIQS